jgi:hypothetical protein
LLRLSLETCLITPWPHRLCLMCSRARSQGIFSPRHLCDNDKLPDIQLHTYCCSLPKSKKRNIHIWMLWDRVSNPLRTVSNKVRSHCSSVAVDGLGIAALRAVICGLGGSEVHDVRPLLELLRVCSGRSHC